MDKVQAAQGKGRREESRSARITEPFGSQFEVFQSGEYSATIAFREPSVKSYIRTLDFHLRSSQCFRDFFTVCHFQVQQSTPLAEGDEPCAGVRQPSCRELDSRMIVRDDITCGGVRLACELLRVTCVVSSRLSNRIVYSSS